MNRSDIPFYYHPRMLEYDFGPQHPLKPERLRRAIQLAEALGWQVRDPGPGNRADALSMHDEEYVHAVETIGSGATVPGGYEARFGFGSLDNPSFHGMYEASLAYLAGSAQAARDVRDGAHLAINLSGGLHHGHRDRASGFCVFNDAAITCHILRERFERVAYVDIDLHHGDGVQWLFYNDPQVLTASIHQEGSRFFPGTGWVTETGPVYTSVNVPLAPGTTGDVWLEAFSRGILTALERFAPQAIVLQMGVDPHETDPLGQLRVSIQEWWQAVAAVRDLGLPIVALGGGGYRLQNVPRMWVGACEVLIGREPPERLPEALGEAWGTPWMRDQHLPAPRQGGIAYAEHTLESLQRDVIGRIPTP